MSYVKTNWLNGTCLWYLGTWRYRLQQDESVEHVAWAARNLTTFLRKLRWSRAA